MRYNYWSCSKIAEKIRGTNNPGVLSAKEWKEWNHKAKNSHPFRFWVADTALDKIQDFIYWPADKIYNMKCYLHNRFVSHSHQLTANSKHVKIGQWCDLADRIQYCLFDTLVDFVEIELADSYIGWNQKRNEYKVPFSPFKQWRCAQAGIDSLIWQESLVYDENSGIYPGDKLFGKPTQQAISAREIHELYTWWTEVYPNRPDPMDESGWSVYCSTERNGDNDLLETSAKRKETKKIIDKTTKLEKKYHDEDTAMMIRLIKVRDFLWT